MDWRVCERCRRTSRKADCPCVEYEVLVEEYDGDEPEVVWSQDAEEAAISRVEDLDCEDYAVASEQATIEARVRRKGEHRWQGYTIRGTTTVEYFAERGE